MGNLTIATIFMVTLNIIFFFSMEAMQLANPGATICYHTTGTVLQDVVTESGGEYTLTANITSDMPEGQSSSITAGATGFFLIDIFNNILSWFKTAPGLKYVYGVVASPAVILGCLQLPTYVSVGLGALWYITAGLIFLAFLWGRD